MSESVSSLLGQRVTLVTMRDIRYEGTLHSFDTYKFTVTLSAVRNLGTENRAASVKVHPSKAVLPFVTFNAYYVKTGPHYVGDPAILSCQDLSPPKEKTPVVKMLNNDRKNGARMIDMKALLDVKDSSSRGRKRGDTRRRGSPEERKRDSKHSKKRELKNNSRSPRRVSFQVLDGDKGSSRNSPKRKDGSSGSVRSQRPPQIPKHIPVRFPSDKKDGLLHPHKGKGAGEQQRGKHDEASPKKRRTRSSLSHSGEFAKDTKSALKYDEDFDFDKGLEEFKELSVNDDAKVVEKEEQKLPKACYNMEKSFFDNLSTSSTVDSLRVDRRKEMKTNKETFGMSVPPGWRRYFRTGFRRYPFQRAAPAASSAASAPPAVSVPSSAAAAH